MIKLYRASKQTPIVAETGVAYAPEIEYTESTISLRERLKSEIPNTTYLTHAIHNVYPAKFIPQVPRFVIKTFNLQNKVILDPFAGSGTTAVEAMITGNSAICNDINPLTAFLASVKTLRLNASEYLSYSTKLMKIVDYIFNVDLKFTPSWNNIEYWYPPNILSELTRVWGGIYNISVEEDILNIVKASALYISRKYSYAEDDSPKLFRSKHKAQKITKLLTQFEFAGKRLLQNELQNKAKEYLDSIYRLNTQYNLDFLRVNSCTGIEPRFLFTPSKSLDELKNVIPEGKVDCIITSPPYIYAQEYFRSTKIDLYWLNLVNDEIVQSLIKKEIGQKSKSFSQNGILQLIKNYQDDLEAIRELSKKFKTPENVYRFIAYFEDMYYFIQISRELLSSNGILATFIGEPKVFGRSIKVKDIFIEMMVRNGIKPKYAFFDAIKSRHLSKYRLNANPEGISGEWLLIGEKV